ncbi:hypothetical protein [Geothrix fuzhouensis]|uniref:hypothetical protein n=1 Tax=Geothrix fuzhouensis TaxID=2966451 RepID=UPI002147AB10|nr:hypothetical protein [Geothrix fuzhouensis]
MNRKALYIGIGTVALLGAIASLPRLSDGPGRARGVADKPLAQPFVAPSPSPEPSTKNLLTSWDGLPPTPLLDAQGWSAYKPNPIIGRYILNRLELGFPESSICVDLGCAQAMADKENVSVEEMTIFLANQSLRNSRDWGRKRLVSDYIKEATSLFEIMKSRGMIKPYKYPRSDKGVNK